MSRATARQSLRKRLHLARAPPRPTLEPCPLPAQERALSIAELTRGLPNQLAKEGKVRARLLLV